MARRRNSAGIAKRGASSMILRREWWSGRGREVRRRREEEREKELRGRQGGSKSGSLEGEGMEAMIRKGGTGGDEQGGEKE